MIVKYNGSALLSPNNINPAALGRELLAAGLPVLYVDGMPAMSLGAWGTTQADNLWIHYTQALTGDDQSGEVADALAVIAAHDATASADVNEIRIEVPAVMLDPNPGSNAWADVPEAAFTVAEDRRVTGRVSLSCWVGTTSTPCGAEIDFECARVGAGDVVYSFGSSDRGNIAGFRSQLALAGADTLKLQIRRRQTPVVKVTVKIEGEVFSL